MHVAHPYAGRVKAVHAVPAANVLRRRVEEQPKLVALQVRWLDSHMLGCVAVFHAAATAKCFGCHAWQPSLVYTPHSVASCIMEGCKSKLCAPLLARCLHSEVPQQALHASNVPVYLSQCPSVRPCQLCALQCVGDPQHPRRACCTPSPAFLITAKSMPAAHPASPVVGVPAARRPAAGRRRTRRGTSRARRAARRRPARARCRRGANCAHRAGTASRAPAPPAAPAAPAPKPNPVRACAQAPPGFMWNQRRVCISASRVSDRHFFEVMPAHMMVCLLKGMQCKAVLSSLQELLAASFQRIVFDGICI